MCRLSSRRKKLEFIIHLPERVIKAETISAVDEIWSVNWRQWKWTTVTTNRWSRWTFLNFTQFSQTATAKRNNNYFSQQNFLALCMLKFTCVGLSAHGPNKLLLGIYPSAFDVDSISIAPPSWLFSMESVGHASKSEKWNLFFKISYDFIFSISLIRWKEREILQVRTREFCLWIREFMNSTLSSSQQSPWIFHLDVIKFPTLFNS